MNHLKNALEKILNPYVLLSLAAFLIIFAFFFEQSDLVKEARVYLSYQDFQNKSLSCEQILKHRPWYGQVNSLGFLWTFLPPLIVFSFKPNTAWYWQLLRTLLLIFGGHVLLIYAFELTSHVRFEIFSVNHYWQIKMADRRPECLGVSSLNSVYLLGWYYSIVYNGIWLNIWKRYHLFFLKTKENFTFDNFTRFVAFTTSLIFSKIFLTFTCLAFIISGYIVNNAEFFTNFSSFTLVIYKVNLIFFLLLCAFYSQLIIPFSFIFLFM